MVFEFTYGVCLAYLVLPFFIRYASLAWLLLLGVFDDSEVLVELFL
jgi:hypothetical protein